MAKPNCKPGLEPHYVKLDMDIYEAERCQHPLEHRQRTRPERPRRIIMMLGVLLLAALRWIVPRLHASWKNERPYFDDARSVISNTPNFIFIMTDDQDLHMNSIQYQPGVQKHFAEQGTFFSKHYCTISICCPSRVSLLTGKAAHKYVHEAYMAISRKIC